MLQIEESKRSPQKKRATFYDIINMIRIRKLLNRKTTTTLTPVTVAAGIPPATPGTQEVTERLKPKVAFHTNGNQVAGWPTANRVLAKPEDADKPRRGSRYS